MHSQTRTHTYTHAPTNTHTHSCARTCTHARACAQTLAQFKAASMKQMGTDALDRDFGGEVPLDSQVCVCKCKCACGCGCGYVSVSVGVCQEGCVRRWWGRRVMEPGGPVPVARHQPCGTYCCPSTTGWTCLQFA